MFWGPSVVTGDAEVGILPTLGTGLGLAGAGAGVVIDRIKWRLSVALGVSLLSMGRGKWCVLASGVPKQGVLVGSQLGL